MDHIFRHITPVGVLFALIGVQTTAAQPPQATADRIDAVENNLSPRVRVEGQAPWTLEERMAVHDVPGLSVAVIHDYQLDWAKAYGVADRRTGRLATTETAFQAASISKTINAIAQLLLVQEGRVDLDADINTALRSWQYPYNPEYGDQTISMRHLLSHTAGTSVHGFGGYRKANRLPSTIEILTGQGNNPTVSSIRAPGERFQYSGGGTTITQLLLEDVTGQPFAQYVHEQVIDPLGLSQTFYSVEDVSTVPRAHAHLQSGRALRRGYNTYPESAAAGYWTTPSDLATLLIDLQRALMGEGGHLLSPDLATLMVTPDSVGAPAGLGVFTETYDQRDYFQHSGANRGFRCQYYASTTGGDGVVVMVNASHFGIIPEVIRSVAAVYGWAGLAPEEVPAVSLTPTQQDTITGTYTSLEDPSRSIVVRVKNGTVLMEEKRKWQTAIVPTSPTTFILESVTPRATAHFLTREDGVRVIEFSQQGEVKTWATDP